MFNYIYRYSTFFNYVLNRLRFPKLRCGRDVHINILGASDFSYGAGSWIAQGTRLDIFNSKIILSEYVNVCRSCHLAPDKTGIKIGKRSKIQEYGRLSGQIDIGDDVIIAPNVYISSGTHVFKKEPYLPIAVQDQRHDNFAGLCIIEDDCWIGMNVCIMPGVTIKRGCIIGAGSIVTRSTEPYSIYGGIPAKKIGTRLELQKKTILDAQRVEDLPYFYQGFDHFNYQININNTNGIHTNATQFSIYTELADVKKIVLEVLGLSCPVILNYQKQQFNFGKTLCEIEINEIQIKDKLIHFSCNNYLSIQRIKFIN